MAEIVYVPVEVERNIKMLKKVYNFLEEDYKIYSLFLIAEEIPALYILAMPLPVVSFTNLKRKGIGLLSFQQTYFQILLLHKLYDAPLFRDRSVNFILIVMIEYISFIINIGLTYFCTSYKVIIPKFWYKLLFT